MNQTSALQIALLLDPAAEGLRRIGRLAPGLAGSKFDDVLVEFDWAGSLPTTHDSQGSEMGLFGGLMGWEADDERLLNSIQVLRDAGVGIRITTVDAGDPRHATSNRPLHWPRSAWRRREHGPHGDAR